MRDNTADTIYLNQNGKGRKFHSWQAACIRPELIPVSRQSANGWFSHKPARGSRYFLSDPPLPSIGRAGRGTGTTVQLSRIQNWTKFLYFLPCPEPCWGSSQRPFRPQKCPRLTNLQFLPSAPPQDTFLAIPMLPSQPPSIITPFDR